MSMGVTVRVLSPGENISPCAEMLSRVLMQTEAALLMDGLEARDPSAVPLAGLCFNPDHELLVAEYSLTIIGMTRLRLHPGRVPNASDWYCEPGILAFDLLMVEPGMREMGVGKALLQGAFQRASELGADELACDLPATATDEIRLLRARGFREVDRTEHDGIPRVVLSRSLEQQSQDQAA